MGGLTTAGQIPPPGKNITVKISQTLSIPKSRLRPMNASMSAPSRQKKNLKNQKKMTNEAAVFFVADFGG